MAPESRLTSPAHRLQSPVIGKWLNRTSKSNARRILASQRVEILRGDGAHVSTAFADQVLALVRAGERVEAGTVPQVHVARDAEPLEQLEVAIDRCQVGGLDLAADHPRKVLGRDGPLDLEQRLE